MVLVVTSLLHGWTLERIAYLLSDLQALVFCSQSHEMHSDLIPMLKEIGKGQVDGASSHTKTDFKAFSRNLSEDGQVKVKIFFQFVLLCKCMMKMI